MSNNFAPGRKFNDWTVVRQLDAGGFGQVYIVRNEKKNMRAALKAEAAVPDETGFIDSGSIKLEIEILRSIHKSGVKPHVPECFHAAKHTKFCYMIMTLLGENLKTLKSQNEGEFFTYSTWLRLGIQCLYSLKIVHDEGFVHRDIKPCNFVMGDSEDPERARILYILDFGLARSFAFRFGNKWCVRLARGSCEFRGTMRYASPNVHDRLEQGRRDDIWSLMYVLIECHCGLPWQSESSKAKIENTKCNMRDEIIMQNMPVELHSVLPELRKLDCYQRPDYLGIYNALLAVIKRKKIAMDDPYDWERYESKTPRSKTIPAWHNASAFFKSDPLGIRKGPQSQKQLKNGSGSENKKKRAQLKDDKSSGRSNKNPRKGPQPATIQNEKTDEA